MSGEGRPAGQSMGNSCPPPFEMEWECPLVLGIMALVTMPILLAGDRMYSSALSRISDGISLIDM